MNTHEQRHEVSITAVTASGPGALAGHELRCTCGLVWKTSVAPDHERSEHLRYHEKDRRSNGSAREYERLTRADRERR